MNSFLIISLRWMSENSDALKLLVSNSNPYPKALTAKWNFTWAPDLLSLKKSRAQSQSQILLDFQPFQLNTESLTLDFKGYQHTLAHDHAYKTSKKLVKEDRYEWRIAIVLKTEHWRFNKNNAFIGCQSSNVDSKEEGPQIHYRLFVKGQFFYQYLEVDEGSVVPKYLQKAFFQFQDIYQGIVGSTASKEYRTQHNLEGHSNFTYGEVEFLHFFAIMEYIKPQPGEVFWDLGCGTGKPVVISGLCFPQLKRVKGVEIFQNLADLGKQAIKRYNKNSVTGAIGEITQGDILTTDWLDADIVFTSSVCFTQELFGGMMKKAVGLKKGARIISLKATTAQMDYYEETMKHFRVVNDFFQAKMSWGNTSCFIYERI